jgi:hypothetical protein
MIADDVKSRAASSPQPRPHRGPARGPARSPPGRGFRAPSRSPVERQVVNHRVVDVAVEGALDVLGGQLRSRARR